MASALDEGARVRADAEERGPTASAPPAFVEAEAEEAEAQAIGSPARDDDTQPLLPQNGHALGSSTGEEGDAADNSHLEGGGFTPPPSKFEIGSTVDEASVIRRVNWHLLPLFFTIGMLCSIDRANLAFAALEVKSDLRFDDEVYGLGSGIFFIGYALFAVPSTFLCAAVGAPAFLGSTLICWGCVAALFAAMRAPWQFYCLRFLLGLAESGAYPGMWYQMALFYTEREMVLAYTVVSAASSLSGVVGAPIAAGLLQLDGSLGLHGWQWLFMLEGIPAALLGLLVLRVLARTPGTAWFLSTEERYWLVARAMMYGEAVDVGEEVSREELSGHAVHSAFLAGVPFTAAAVGMLLIAQSAKRLGERHWHVAAPLTLGMAAVVVMALVTASSKWVAFAALCLGAVGIWGPHGPLLSWPAAILEGTAAASGFAFVKMMGAFAAALGNAAMGELHEHTGSFEVPMLLLAGLLALGAVLVLSVDKDGRKGRVDVRPLISRLQNRMGMKRSRSDPSAWYPQRTFSGSLSTIREDVARPYGHERPDAPPFEMPDLHHDVRLDQHGSAAERRAIERALAW